MATYPKFQRFQENRNVGPVSNRCSMPNPNDDDDSEDDCDVDIVMMMMSYPLMKLLANCLFGRLANKVRWFCWKSLFEICFNKRVAVFNSLYLHRLQGRCCSHKPHLTLRPATFRINYAHINACESQPPSSNLPLISLSGLGTCKWVHALTESTFRQRLRDSASRNRFMRSFGRRTVEVQH